MTRDHFVRFLFLLIFFLLFVFSFKFVSFARRYTLKIFQKITFVLKNKFQKPSFKIETNDKISLKYVRYFNFVCEDYIIIYKTYFIHHRYDVTIIICWCSTWLTANSIICSQINVFVLTNAADKLHLLF